MRNDLKNISIDQSATIISALKQMDRYNSKLLLVFDREFFISILSIGDIQRAIIKSVSLDTTVDRILRKKVKFARPEDSINDIKQMMLEYRMEFCPVVDSQQKINTVHFWEDLFQEDKSRHIKQFNLPVVIMAGGIGARLKPLTNVLPKPLIPIGQKTMLEEIFDRFGKHGCNHFFISINYKAELIEFYLKNEHLPYKLDFFKEESPRGTVGSLTIIKEKIKQTFFVSNCDILIEQDYSDILDYHNENKNEITLVAAIKSYAIPYGTVETGDNGKLIELKEKPELNFKINSGMYILEPHLLSEIPNDKYFHITNLIENIINRKGKVGVFPVSEKSWKDIGSWSEYIKLII